MPKESNRKKLLLYSHGELLGDAILKLPALSVLKEAFPDHEIIWCAGRGPSLYAGALAPLVKGYVDHVMDAVRIGDSWRELLSSPLKHDYYDVIIDTQTILRSTILLKRIPHRCFISAAAGFFFSDKKPQNKKLMGTGSVQQRLIKLIELASGKSLNQAFHFSLPQKYRELARELLPEGNVYIGFAPGAGGERKRWPLESFLLVAKEQNKKNRISVFFLGPQEEEWKEQIKQAVPEARFPEQENKNTDIRGPLLSMALAERIQAGVANDSGTGHIFSISGCPMISLFGHTNAEKFVQPREDRIVLSASDYGDENIRSIPFSAVNEKIEALLI